MSAKKKDKGKNKKGEKDVSKTQNIQNLMFEPIVYITNKPATMLDMLDSPEPKLLLRIIGTLDKACVKNDVKLDCFLSCGLYGKLISLLSLSDIYILRFTLSLVDKVVVNTNFLHSLELGDIFATANLVKEHYLKLKDDIISSLTVNILVNLSKYHSLVSHQIYSTAIIEKIFEILKTNKNLEMVLDNMKLLFYVMDSPKAEEEILRCNGFSIMGLLCLFESNHLFIKQLALNVFHKIAMWKKSEVLSTLGRAKVPEAMIRLLFTELLAYYTKAFEIIYACLSEDECAQSFVKSLEFVRFLEWAKMCPKTSVGQASSILKTLSDRGDLIQVLFDFSMEESAISLFRFVNESVILNICDVILNMMRHKYCCESMATTSLVKILVEIMSADELFPTVPYGEKALETLHRFFQCHLKTVKLVYDSGTIDTLVEIFSKAKTLMTEQAFVHIIEIIQYLAKSEYCEFIKNVQMYQLIIDLYIESTFEEGMILTIMETFFDCDEFRELLLERGVLEAMMEKVKNHKDLDCNTQTLVAIKKLITYKAIGLAFIEQGHLGKLRSYKENFKFDTCIIDHIISALHDFCLTLKFFYENKLFENDKIRDQFILIPDAIMSIPAKYINFNSKMLSERIPIYTVDLQDLIHEGAEDPNVKSMMEIDEMDANIMMGSRRLAQRESEISPFHRLAMFTQKLYRSSYDIVSVLSNKNSLQEDSQLTKIILNVYKEIHEENPSSYPKIQHRVKYIARCINDFLSISQTVKAHVGIRHSFEHHLRKLIAALGSNFIPIGFLKIGFQCERALLFKIVCDQTKVPTTLCKREDSYFNEITIFGNNGDLDAKGCLVQKTFIVDLMDNIGDLIPIESAKAVSYLKRHRTKF